MRVLSTFLIENEYVKIKPTDGISVLGKSHRNGKNRDYIPNADRAKLSEYLRLNDKPMLLACEVLYYCFIRPKEMSFIKIEHISLDNVTIFIPGATAKNYKNAVVTIPKSLLEHFVNLNIEKFPKDFYLFSENMLPGKEHRDEKQFRDRWGKVRKALKFPLTYKFYSLKDTGITNLISLCRDTRLVRDQARHSSISITDLYTPHDTIVGNENIAKTEAIF